MAPSSPKLRPRVIIPSSLRSTSPPPTSPAPTTTHKPLPTSTAPQPIPILRLRRASMQIPIPPHHWSPAADDLSACVTQMIKARPSPRRSQPDFYFCSDTQRNPVAPPSTPTEESCRTPIWGKYRRVRWLGESGETEGSENGMSVDDDDCSSGRASTDSERSI